MLSRFHETGVMKGVQVEVVGGWDAPLHTAFLDVTVPGEELPVLDSMMLHFGKCLSVVELRDLATKWQVQLPEHFWQTLEADVLPHLA